MFPAVNPNDAGKARTLFTRASYIPSPWVLDSLPKTCGSTTCTDSECIGLWHTEESRSLHHPSPMVRDVQRPYHRIVCNLWGCEVQLQADPATGQMTLQRCQKCQEVLYCGREHQARSFVSSCPVWHSWIAVLGLGYP